MQSDKYTGNESGLKLPFIPGKEVFFLDLVDVADDDRETSFHKEWVILDTPHS